MIKDPLAFSAVRSTDFDSVPTADPSDKSLGFFNRPLSADLVALLFSGHDLPCPKVISPQSGRMIVAQQFTAGDRSARICSP